APHRPAPDTLLPYSTMGRHPTSLAAATFAKECPHRAASRPSHKPVSCVAGRAKRAGATEMKQIPLAIGLDTSQSFDSFVPGSNTMALEHLLAMDAASPPVYLWGPSGSGKTHLLQSLAQRFQQQGGIVAWFGAADAAPWTADD